MTLPVITSLFSTQPWVTASVFVGAGLLGGFVGYLMNNASIRWTHPDFIKSLIFGTMVSAAGVLLLTMLYSELFIPSGQNLLNLLLAGCICFMLSVVILMFGYGLIMRLTTLRKRTVGHTKIPVR